MSLPRSALLAQPDTLRTAHSAQGTVLLSGTILLGGSRAVPLAGTLVTLHFVGPRGAGALDSMKTDAQGRFRFEVKQPDTTAQYAAGLRYSGVGYVSNMAGPGSIRSMSLGVITVYDTSSTVPVEVTQRHLLIQRPDQGGAIPVLELIVLRNASGRTRVAPDSVATWKTRLIAGAQETELGSTDFDHDAVQHTGDSVAVGGPITPGEKQIVLTYVLPRHLRQLVLPLENALDTLGIMVFDTLSQRVSGPVAALGTTSFENQAYIRFEGSHLRAGDSVVLTLTRQPLEATDYWWVIVALSAATLIATGAWWWRRDCLRAAFSDEELAALQVLARETSPR